MTSYVTLVLDRYDGAGNPYVRGGGTLSPSLEFPDAADQMLVGMAPVPFTFRSGSVPTVKVLPNDLYGPQGASAPGWTWNIAYDPGTPGNPAGASYYILSTNGATQYLSDLASVPAAQPGQQYLPLIGGTMGGWLAPRVVTLADAPVVLVDASRGNDFRWAIGGSHALGAPSAPSDGQIITVDIQQPASGGPWTPLFASGAGGYAFGADGQPAWSTAANAVDEVGFRYHAIKNAWLCQGWKLGF